MRDQKSSIYLESFKKCETFVEECHWHQLNILKPGNQNWKGQCHKIFCIRVFSWIIFPQAPENNTRVISIFRKFAKIFASQGAPQISMTMAAKLPLVSMTPPENFLLVSTTNFATTFHRYCWYQRQTFLFTDFFICHGVNDTGGAPWAANILTNFRKNLKWRKWYNEGFGENWFM